MIKTEWCINDDQLIRCKDCRHSQPYYFCAGTTLELLYFCYEAGHSVMANGYCSKAVSRLLTKEEIKTIRIHMNAFKEQLCNQNRYKEASEYQQIVDKLDTMMNADKEEE